MSTTDEAFNSGYRLALRHVTAMAQELADAAAPSLVAESFIRALGLITTRLEKVVDA